MGNANEIDGKVNGWFNTGYLLYTLRLQDRIFCTVQGRFTGYARSEGDSVEHQSWVVCENIVNLDDERECRKKCGYEFGKVIRLIYGSENVFYKAFPDKEEQDVVLASMISRRVPLNKCLSKKTFYGSANEVQEEICKMIFPDCFSLPGKRSP